jgi:PilZ domain
MREETIFSFSTEAPKPPERRQGLRNLTILRVGALIVDGRRELCLIRNISAGGMMAHVYSVLPVDKEVQVELKTNEGIPGRVLWMEESNVGVEFHQPIDVAEMLASHAALENGWRPRLPRVEVDCLGELRIGSATYPVNTCDISQGGVKIELDRAIPKGSDAVLVFEKLRPVHGVVRWYHEGQAGIGFNQVIPFHELMAWLRSKS